MIWIDFKHIRSLVFAAVKVYAKAIFVGYIFNGLCWRQLPPGEYAQPLDYLDVPLCRSSASSKFVGDVLGRWPGETVLGLVGKVIDHYRDGGFDFDIQVFAIEDFSNCTISPRAVLFGHHWCQINIYASKWAVRLMTNGDYRTTVGLIRVNPGLVPGFSFHVMPTAIQHVVF